MMASSKGEGSGSANGDANHASLSSSSSSPTSQQGQKVEFIAASSSSSDVAASSFSSPLFQEQRQPPPHQLKSILNKPKTKRRIGGGGGGGGRTTSFAAFTKSSTIPISDRSRSDPFPSSNNNNNANLDNNNNLGENNDNENEMMHGDVEMGRRKTAAAAAPSSRSYLGLGWSTSRSESRGTAATAGNSHHHEQQQQQFHHPPPRRSRRASDASLEASDTSIGASSSGASIASMGSSDQLNLLANFRKNNHSNANATSAASSTATAATTRRTTFSMRLSPLFSPKESLSLNDDEIDRIGISGSTTRTSNNSTTSHNHLHHSNLHSGSNVHHGSSTLTSRADRKTTILRRKMGFNAGDHVLITNHDLADNHPILVNRYGYPEYAGRTPEERRGPYVYLLARVVSVHFGEDARYYTVRREDSGEERRADAPWMEPLQDPKGIEAAKAAVRRTLEFDEDGKLSAAACKKRSRGLGRSGGTSFRHCVRRLCCSAAVERTVQRWTERRTGWVRRTKKRTGSCLNGNRPYGISIRWTGVNFFVGCSLWYLYIDQLRLAFMPHSWDYGCAIISCIVWIVLFIELMMEVFIRPNGYRALLKSERAYLPSTVRYLNNFHLFSEMISLIFFIPEFMCLFSSKSCGDRFAFSLPNACIMSVYGPTRLQAFYGTAFICMLRLRIFGLVRHWTKMWINNTFVKVRGRDGEWRVQRGKGIFVPQVHRGGESVMALEESVITIPTKEAQSSSFTKRTDIGGSIAPSQSIKEKKNNDYTDDYHLTNASKIGTALFTTNAQRGLVFIFFIGLFPLVGVMIAANGRTNQQIWNSVELLQANNLALNKADNETCAQLERTVDDWIKTNAFEETLIGSTKYVHLLTLDIQPIRCDFQKVDGAEEAGTLAAVRCRSEYMMDNCDDLSLGTEDCTALCLGWAQSDGPASYVQEHTNIRPSVIVPVSEPQQGNGVEGEYSLPDGEIVPAKFSVYAEYNESLSVKRTILVLFVLQLGMTAFVLLGLSVLRYDAGRLVLGPLRRMLKIVAFYAKNPLSPPPQKDLDFDSSERSSFQKKNEAYLYDSDDETNDKQLGTFETEQLINAVTKITDLLRKCWGVAGAGIISSNLTRQEGGLSTYFNPTVPGEAVYALFAFAAIDKFQSHLHALKGDIMILINDIAAVLHEEVYRWGYEDRGECNKNLGGAFLMVYRIGAVSEVVEKREKAEAVIFSKRDTAKVRRRRSRRLTKEANSASIGRSKVRVADSDRFSRSHVDNLDLSSLPGMRTFTDRALLGLLKTFASIHRDKTILNWNNDFRLGAGVRAGYVDLRFGMDAGWAVEGAVGSLYKIDATYLSPHVNMASRMMSATKQYGVYILLSQAVQRLLSENAQDKLRHLDTVTVKGSSVQQKIYTYDAKVREDFFLYSRTESQADLDSERYTPQIWNTDQDLVAMRTHVFSEFMDVFNRGRDEYLAGNWPRAIQLLKSADELMYERQVEEGYSRSNYWEEDDEDEEKRVSMGDGPCQRLIAFMEDRGGEAPDNWRGYRPLTSK